MKCLIRFYPQNLRLEWDDLLQFVWVFCCCFTSLNKNWSSIWLKVNTITVRWQDVTPQVGPVAGEWTFFGMVHLEVSGCFLSPWGIWNHQPKKKVGWNCKKTRVSFCLHVFLVQHVGLFKLSKSTISKFDCCHQGTNAHCAVLWAACKQPCRAWQCWNQRGAWCLVLVYKTIVEPAIIKYY